MNGFISKIPIVGLLAISGVVMAEGQIAIVTNDTIVESGEELGATVVLNGEGQYDVYLGITGGVFGGDIYAFDKNGALEKWDPAGAPPAKLRDNVNLADMSVKERLIKVLPRMTLSEYVGSYTFYAALSTPGELDFPIIDTLNVDVK
jgi:Zn-dependent alcohol dehydrogenase